MDGDEVGIVPLAVSYQNLSLDRITSIHAKGLRMKATISLL